MMILMTSNSAVSVISECKGNYGSAKYYYYLILVTGWRWDLVNPAPIWPREEWGLPLPSTPLKACKGRTVQARWSLDSAPSSSCNNLDSYFAFMVSGGGFFPCAANWEKGDMSPYHPSCLHLVSKGSKHAFSLSYTSFAVLSLSLLCLSSGLLLPPDVAGFSHHFYFLTVVWVGLQQQVLLGLYGISPSSVLAAQTLKARRGVFKPGFAGMSDQMTSWGPCQLQLFCVLEDLSCYWHSSSPWKC